MKNSIEETIAKRTPAVRALLNSYVKLDRKFLVRSDLVEAFQQFTSKKKGEGLRDTALADAFLAAQEATICPPYFYLATRPQIATWEFYRIEIEELESDRVDVAEYLRFKEQMMEPNQKTEDWVLEVDLSPFEREFPKMERVGSIGRGVEFLNRHLSSRLFSEKETGKERVLHFLQAHNYRGQQLMLNGAIQDVRGLREALRSAQKYLKSVSSGSTWKDVGEKLSSLGFQPGWGRTARQIADSMNLLSDIYEAPDPASLENFLGRIPMIFNLVILSPHGFFGQADVLGKPDTGGQVVYILDQVRALEHAMRQSIHDQGLDIEPNIIVLTRLIPEADGTTCNQEVEAIEGTKNGRIIRIPFRYPNGEVVPHWISRFRIWPFLERYSQEAEQRVLNELGGRPDFIIGNYSDGNLVSSLMAHRLGVTQCTIAHALEKTKYLYSDLYWKEHEKEHNFSCQFTADLIAMNTADFIISSTYQEIAGTEDSIGQYESYSAFTMPGLYRVVKGIDSFDPKFNIVSPGADDQIFYSYSEDRNFSKEIQDEVADLVHGGPRPDVCGEFTDKKKPMLFAMSRLDKIKNMSGLVEFYGKSPALQKEANLLLVGGQFDPSKSDDAEEQHQIKVLHDLIQEYNLHGKIRWVVMQTDKLKVGEFYRCVARHRGAFVQPALFEAFGLTVIEAMGSGLPVFATQYGGPLEIIENGISGFHINPNHGDVAAALMTDFFKKCRKDSKHWETLSQGSLDRVAARYTWKLYAHRLLVLSRVYGFWRYISNIDREETARYLEMFYGLMYRPLAEKVPVE